MKKGNFGPQFPFKLFIYNWVFALIVVDERKLEVEKNIHLSLDFTSFRLP